jgi:dihydrofolate reductase
VIGAIAAVSPEWVIGLDGKVPWRHPGDMRRFKRVTQGSTVIMGRLTWESMNGKPLPNRRNVVLTSQALPGVETYRDVESALATVPEPVWFIGGARVYAEGMPHCDLLDITFVPDHIHDARAVRFPPIDESLFDPGPMIEHEDEPGLARRVYRRKLRT